MRGFLYRLVERLHDRERPLSRNKHFHVFSGQGAKKALRIDKHLKDLERHLEALMQKNLKPKVTRLPDGGAQLVLAELNKALVRTATLTREEVLLLREHPAGLWALADRPNPHSPLWLLVLAGLVFLAGWSLARGANMQKYLFKTRPAAVFLGRIAPRTVAADGKEVLVSGFWGLARHINYLGEILMAVGLTLALGYPASPWPWLYPLYYVALLVPRQHFDDARCAAKYGALWAEYQRQVPWRIIPRVY